MHLQFSLQLFILASKNILIQFMYVNLKKIQYSFGINFPVLSFIFINFFTLIGDIVGKMLAWLSLAPIFILVGFVAVIIFRRELQTVG